MISEEWKEHRKAQWQKLMEKFSHDNDSPSFALDELNDQNSELCKNFVKSKNSQTKYSVLSQKVGLRNENKTRYSLTKNLRKSNPVTKATCHSAINVNSDLKFGRRTYYKSDLNFSVKEIKNNCSRRHNHDLSNLTSIVYKDSETDSEGTSSSFIHDRSYLLDICQLVNPPNIPQSFIKNQTGQLLEQKCKSYKDKFRKNSLKNIRKLSEQSKLAYSLFNTSKNDSLRADNKLKEKCLKFDKTLEENSEIVALDINDDNSIEKCSKLVNKLQKISESEAFEVSDCNLTGKCSKFFKTLQENSVPVTYEANTDDNSSLEGNKNNFILNLGLIKSALPFTKPHTISKSSECPLQKIKTECTLLKEISKSELVSHKTDIKLVNNCASKNMRKYRQVLIHKNEPQNFVQTVPSTDVQQKSLDLFETETVPDKNYKSKGLYSKSIDKIVVKNLQQSEQTQIHENEAQRFIDCTNLQKNSQNISDNETVSDKNNSANLKDLADCKSKRANLNNLLKKFTTKENYLFSNESEIFSHTSLGLRNKAIGGNVKNIDENISTVARSLIKETAKEEKSIRIDSRLFNKSLCNSFMKISRYKKRKMRESDNSDDAEPIKDQIFKDEAKFAEDSKSSTKFGINRLEDATNSIESIRNSKKDNENIVKNIFSVKEDDEDNLTQNPVIYLKHRAELQENICDEINFINERINCVESATDSADYKIRSSGENEDKISLQQAINNKSCETELRKDNLLQKESKKHRAKIRKTESQKQVFTLKENEANSIQEEKKTSCETTLRKTQAKIQKTESRKRTNINHQTMQENKKNHETTLTKDNCPEKWGKKLSVKIQTIESDNSASTSIKESCRINKEQQTHEDENNKTNTIVDDSESNKNTSASGKDVLNSIKTEKIKRKRNLNYNTIIFRSKGFKDFVPSTGKLIPLTFSNDSTYLSP